MEGNVASALGLLFGGASVMAYYPITPASSIAENFKNLLEKYRNKGHGVLEQS